MKQVRADIRLLVIEGEVHAQEMKDGSMQFLHVLEHNYTPNDRILKVSGNTNNYQIDFKEDGAYTISGGSSRQTYTLSVQPEKKHCIEVISLDGGDLKMQTWSYLSLATVHVDVLNLGECELVFGSADSKIVHVLNSASFCARGGASLSVTVPSKNMITNSLSLVAEKGSSLRADLSANMCDAQSRRGSSLSWNSFTPCKSLDIEADAGSVLTCKAPSVTTFRARSTEAARVTLVTEKPGAGTSSTAHKGHFDISFPKVNNAEKKDASSEQCLMM